MIKGNLRKREFILAYHSREIRVILTEQRHGKRDGQSDTNRKLRDHIFIHIYEVEENLEVEKGYEFSNANHNDITFPERMYYLLILQTKP